MSDIVIDGVNYGPDASQGFPVYTDPGGYAQQTGGQVASPSLVDTTPAANSGAAPVLGWVTNVVGQWSSLAQARYAQDHNLVQQRAAGGQPVYTSSGLTIPAPSGNAGAWLMIGGIALGVALLLKKAG